MSLFKNKTLMITGGTGSFGSTVLKHFLDSDLKEMEYDIVAGRLPKGDKNEVAISEYVFKTFEKAGYVDKTGKKSQIKSFEEMIGKQIKI